MEIISDEEVLIKYAADGNKDAFGQLVLKYQKFVYNTCLRYIHNSEDAYDISQETFIKAYNSIAKFKFESSFATWLYRITVNSCKDFIKKESRKTVIGLSELSYDDTDADADIPDNDSNNNPELSYLKKERIRAVRTAITSLPAEYREILVMRDIEGISYEEISDMTGLKLGTVKTRINRGRRILKKTLENGNFFQKQSSNNTEKEDYR